MIDILAKRRSIRKFTPEQVADESIDMLLQAALYSASSRGFRPWELVVVTDRTMLKQLAGAKAHGSAFLAGAPLAFVVLGIPGESDVWIEDTSIIGANLLTAAESLGLGACWIQIRNRKTAEGSASDERVRELLTIPVTRSVEAIIAFGYPAEEKSGYTREDLHWEKVYRGHWGKVSGTQ